MPNDHLPAPTSGLFLEVSFRRLLSSCEDIVAGVSVARPDLAENWRRSPVFHHYVDTLQEQLADLQASAGSRIPRDLLEQYSRHVDSLSRQLQRPEVPAYCAMPPAGAPLQQQQQQQQHAQVPGTGAGAAAGAAGGPPAVPRPPVVAPVPVARTPPIQPPQSAAAAAATKQPQNNEAKPKPKLSQAEAQPLSASGHSRLATQQQLHEDLTEELAGLAAQLKSNTLAIEGRLKERGQLLESTETALDTSLQKTRESKQKAAQVHQRGRVNFCLTCLVMLIVGMTFAAMYVFIKFTRIAGYRAAVTGPASPPAAAVPAPSEPLLPSQVPVYEEHYEL